MRSMRSGVVPPHGFNGQDARALLAAAAAHQLRLIGANSLRALAPGARLHASFAPRAARPGRPAFLSRSGALITAIQDWAGARDTGFSSVVSVGNLADVDLTDLIVLYAADTGIDAILLYVEGVTNAARFISAVRAATLVKPVIAIKAGRTEAACRAALSHTAR